MASPQVQQQQHEDNQHPVDAAAVAPMAPKQRPNIESPKKRKLSDAEDVAVASPTSPATMEQQPISPKKKARAEPKRETGKDADLKQQQQQPSTPSASLQFEPIPLHAEPQPLSDEELRILRFFLDA